MPLSGLGLTKNILPRDRSTRSLGDEGERLAAEYLARRGYTLVARNFETPVGRTASGKSVRGELDIVALKDGVLCFVEVKTRRAPSLYDPAMSVGPKKKRQIEKAGRAFKRVFGIQSMKTRFDVVTILIPSRRAPIIRHLKGFWKENVYTA